MLIIQSKIKTSNFKFHSLFIGQIACANIAQIIIAHNVQLKILPHPRLPCLDFFVQQDQSFENTSSPPLHSFLHPQKKKRVDPTPCPTPSSFPHHGCRWFRARKIRQIRGIRCQWKPNRTRSLPEPHRSIQNIGETRCQRESHFRHSHQFVSSNTK